MIKSLTIYRLARSPEEFNKLSAFLKGLGFEAAEGWSDEYSRGALIWQLWAIWKSSPDACQPSQMS